MAIVSSQSIPDVYAQADDTRYVRHLFTDSQGTVHKLSLRKHPSTWTETEFAAWRAGAIPQLESDLANVEAEALLGGG